jgi:hypothetical protein
MPSFDPNNIGPLMDDVGLSAIQYFHQWEQFVELRRLAASICFFSAGPGKCYPPNLNL